MRVGVMAAGVALFAGMASCGDPGSNAVFGGGASTTVQGGTPLFAPLVDCATPATGACGTWTYLYACYFGSTQPESGVGCAGAGGVCHALMTDTGAVTSGFVCGSTQQSCYAGITMSAIPGLPTLVLSSKEAPALLTALFKAGTTPQSKADNMPASGLSAPPVTNATWHGFTPADIDCINTWVNAGAPNN
jgi:hypothetical protein